VTEASPCLVMVILPFRGLDGRICNAIDNIILIRGDLIFLSADFAKVLLMKLDLEPGLSGALVRGCSRNVQKNADLVVGQYE
jgi:hypothetical protein